MNKQFHTLLMSCLALFALSGCAKIGNSLNPFQEEPPPRAFLGDPNDHALREGGNHSDGARAALESISRYPKAHQPQPVNPVVQPSVVRLMWVPDHLNPQGDLVPSHYYYLKVLEDRWAVTDVFDQQKLINGSSSQNSSTIPFTSAR